MAFTIQNSVLIKKYDKAAPATASFVAPPCHQQLSSPAADSSYPVPQMFPLTFVAVVAMIAQGMVVAREVAVAVVVLVVVALARAVVVALSVVVAVALAVATTVAVMVAVAVVVTVAVAVAVVRAVARALARVVARAVAKVVVRAVTGQWRLRL
jgi:hypothetical protein